METAMDPCIVEPETSQEEEENDVDPRIEGELETLNNSSLGINQLEQVLEKARKEFSSMLSTSSETLKNLHTKIGSSVNQARPYYELKRKAHLTCEAAQQAAVAFEAASRAHHAAKEKLADAEEMVGSCAEGQDKLGWLEEMNKSLEAVFQSEKHMTECEAHHLEISSKVADLDRQQQLLLREKRRNIAKARPYFEQYAMFSLELNKQKQLVEKVQSDLATAKTSYKQSLRNLEVISNEIHERRRTASNVSAIIRKRRNETEEAEEAARTNQSPDRPLPESRLRSRSLESVSESAVSPRKKGLVRRMSIQQEMVNVALPVEHLLKRLTILKQDSVVSEGSEASYGLESDSLRQEDTKIIQGSSSHEGFDYIKEEETSSLTLTLS